ncbi:dephospho-CoA kinase [Erysipelothrix sp. D19-032]
MKIAITGTIGGGKSQASEYLRSLGFEVYDTDKMVHDYYEKNGRLYDPLITMFGHGILTPTGDIDRSKIAAIVFNDYEKLDALENLVFPQIQEDVNQVNAQNQIMFFEVPLLFESHSEKTFDKVMMITAPYSTRIQRLARRGLDEEEVNRRSKRHLDEASKIEKSNFVINNDGSLVELHDCIDAVIHKLRGEQ